MGMEEVGSMIALGLILLIGGLFMCTQNTATVVGGPAATVGVVLLLVKLFQ
jgi:hypothetical protein